LASAGYRGLGAHYWHQPANSQIPQNNMKYLGLVRLA
jgi:hypothetical protein